MRPSEGIQAFCLVITVTNVKVENLRAKVDY